ncbi:MAG: OsmC family protein [Omnitrophica WOR_2 bacterium]
MDAKVSWQGKMAFSGTADTGFTLPLGTDPSVGGENDGFLPLELMALSLAGCTAMDVISILKKKQQEVTDFEVKVHADQQDEYPHVFTHVTVEYIVSGRNVRSEAVERSIELSKTKYCPAIAMLSGSVPIEYTYRIIEAA